jgi:hypothetical protein
VISAFPGKGQYYAAGFYTKYRCASVNTTSDAITTAQKTVASESNQLYAVPGQDCESEDFNILAAYGVGRMPSDLLAQYWASPNNWFADLTAAGFNAAQPL